MSEAYPSRMACWMDRIDRMPRILRIILALLIALELTALLSVIVDQILIDNVVQGDVGPMVPALIATGLGLLFYGVGWWAMVGFDAAPWRAGVPAVVYVGAGVTGLVLMILLVLFGLAFGYIL